MEKNQIQDFNARKNGKLPAFPTDGRSEGESIGLTKREYFAGIALAAIIHNVPVTNANVYPNFHAYGQSISDAAIQVADTLLKRLG